MPSPSLIPVILGCVLLASPVPGGPFDIILDAKLGRQSEAGPAWSVQEGAWGEMEICPFRLHPTEGLVRLSVDRSRYREGTVWLFPGRSEEAVRTLLGECGVEEDAISMLMKPPYLERTEKGIVIHPPASLVIALPGSVRDRLYPRIGRKGNHDPFQDPFVLDREGIQEMARVWKLSRQTAALIGRLSWFNHGVRQFSDEALVLQRAGSDRERFRIMAALSDEPSLFAKLRLSESSDMEALAAWWSGGGVSPEVLPVLESACQSPGGESLDILHLLPPLPRKLLHTYSQPTLSMGGVNPDCYWTAFNFFSDEPSNRVHDEDYLAKVLLSEYERAVPPLQFGDVLLIWSEKDKRQLHACNYVAGNVVFTKNGASFKRPWVLNRFPHILGKYMISEKISINVFRKRR